MKRDDEMQIPNRIKFFEKIRREEAEDIDDATFNMWKTELKRELSTFWDSMEDKK